MGDHMTGQMTAGAICAALYNREKTGEGQRVSVPLVRVGVYMCGWDVMLALRLGLPILPYDRYHAVNPIIDCYKAGDGRWFWLLLLQADRHWGDLCRAIGREDLMADERFKNIEVRRINAPALVEELDNVFATKTDGGVGGGVRGERRLVGAGELDNEVVKDPMVQAAGAFVDVPGPDGTIPHGVDAGGLLGHAVGSRGAAAGAGAAHGGGAAGAGLRLGGDYRAEGAGGYSVGGRTGSSGVGRLSSARPTSTSGRAGRGRG